MKFHLPTESAPSAYTYIQWVVSGRKDGNTYMEGTQVTNHSSWCDFWVVSIFPWLKEEIKELPWEVLKGWDWRPEYILVLISKILLFAFLLLQSFLSLCWPMLDSHLLCTFPSLYGFILGTVWSFILIIVVNITVNVQISGPLCLVKLFLIGCWWLKQAT